MQDVAHDRIEVGDNLRIALLGNDTDAVLEGIQGVVKLLFLIVCYTLIIIKSHLVRIVLTGLLTKADDTVFVGCLPGIADQLQTSRRIVRSNLQGLLQHTADTVLRHLLQIHIAGTEQCHVGIGLGSVQQSTKQL